MRQNYRMTALTPLHVGDGQKLTGLDMVAAKGRIWRVDIDRLLSKPEVDAEELADLMETANRFKMSEYLQQKEISPESVTCYSLGSPFKAGELPAELITQLKDSFYRAYIPGSSIKGAMRTALLWWRLKEDPVLLDKAARILQVGLGQERIRKEWFAAALEKAVFGPDPNHDLMRTVRISDSTPIPLERLEVQEVGVMNLVRSSGAGIPGPDACSFRWKMRLFIEAVTKSTCVNFDLNVDDFLLKRDVAGTLGFKDADIVSDIPKICRAYAKEFINQEIDFACKYGLGELENFYRELLKVNGRTDIFLLHLGWGSGWHGMTVGRMFPDMIEDLRHKFGLGHRGVEEFPKTRKIAISGTAQYPLGWAYVTAAKSLNPPVHVLV